MTYGILGEATGLRIVRSVRSAGKMFNSNSTLIVLLVLLISFLFVTACKDEPTPVPSTIIDKLNSLDGITFVELVSNNPGVRLFQIDMEQPVDHNNPSGQSFTQRIYLHHVDESRPMVFAPSGYGSSETNNQELTFLLQANCLTATHRYFPDARPDPIDAINIQYLTLAQTATDHHKIVTKFKEIYTGLWISSGGSKGGQTVIYHKRYYPDDVRATVAYSAPFMFTTADQRFPEFLSAIGTNQDRQRIINFQRLVLERRDSLLPLFEAWFTQNGYTLAWDPEQSLESEVIKYECEYWEKTPCETSQIPGDDATDQEILNHLNQVEPFNGQSEWAKDHFWPYTYQGFTEIGRRAIDTSNINDLLRTEQLDPTAPFKEILGIDLFYSSATMDDIYDWVINSGNNIIFIYGGNDPWTAGAVQLQGLTNAIKVVIPGYNHMVSINDLSPEDRNLVISTLEQWLGIDIE